MDTFNILDNISTSVIITNKFMEIVHINASGESFLHNSKANLVKTKIEAIFAHKNNIIVNQVYDAIALNQSSVSRDVEISLKNKWINKKNVESAIKFYGKCDYSQYLSTLIKNH